MSNRLLLLLLFLVTGLFQIIAESRQHCADAIGAAADEIVFTSGGTEGNNMVVMTALEQFRLRVKDNDTGNSIPHIVTSNIEHDSVEKLLQHLEQRSLATVTRVAANSDTLAVNTKDVLGAITNDTCLVTIMLANNETGVLQPVADIFSAIRKDPALDHILLHTDAAQVRIHQNPASWPPRARKAASKKEHAPQGGGGKKKNQQNKAKKEQEQAVAATASVLHCETHISMPFEFAWSATLLVPGHWESACRCQIPPC